MEEQGSSSSDPTNSILHPFLPISFPFNMLSSSIRVSSSNCARSSLKASIPTRSLHLLATATRSIPSTSTPISTKTTEIPRSSFNPINLHASSSRSFQLSAVSREVVKVPQMAESISEGTLKQWVKKVGDYVKADEEVATIETDKVSRNPRVGRYEQ